MSRTHNTAKNFAASMVFIVLSTVLNFVLTPLIIQHLGNEKFGAFRMVGDWFAYLSFLELGLESTLIALLNGAISQDRRPDVKAIARAGFRIYGYLTGLKALIAVLFVLGIQNAVVVDPANQSDLLAGTILAALGLIFTVFVPFRAFLGAAQKSYILKGFMLTQSLVVGGLSLGFAWLGWGMTGQFLAAWLGAMVFFCGIALATLCQWPRSEWAAFLWRGPRASLRVHFKSLAIPSLVIDVSIKLNQLSDSIIVGALLQPTAVVPLFVSQRLAQVAQRILQEVAGASWASLGHIFHGDDLERFNLRVIELTKVTAILACIGLFPIVGLNESLINLWVGAHQYGGDRLTTLVVINAFLISIATLWRWCFMTTGKARALAPITAIETLCYGTIAYFATKELGVYGPALAAVTAFTVTGLWYIPRQMKSHFGTSIGQLWLSLIRPLMILGPTAIALAVLNRLYPVRTWLDLAFAFGAEILVLGLTAYSLVLNGDERHAWRERMGLILRRGP